MAIIKLQDGRTVTVSREKAHALWEVLQGGEATEEQIKFCKQVKAIYTDWRFAPKSYILAHRHIITTMAYRDDNNKVKKILGME